MDEPAAARPESVGKQEQRSFMKRGPAAVRNRVRRIDVRAKILFAIGGLVVILSEPAGSLRPFWLYFSFLAALLLVTGVPFRVVAKRSAVVLPLVLGAAVLILVGGGGGPGNAVSLVLRAFAAVGLISMLVATERVPEILGGLRSLGMPVLFGTLAGFMYRYALLLGDEVVRTDRARRSRTPGRLRVNRFRVYGLQAAVVFGRGWKRSQRVHQAMLARGFNGAFPQARRRRLASADLAFVAASLGALLAVRLWHP